MPSEPERTCVGCRERSPKREMVRVVASADGTVRIDLAGTEPGRGAYLHIGCLGTAVRKATMERALRRGLRAEEIARLRADIEGIGAR